MRRGLGAPGALSAADEAFEREHDTLLAEGLLAQVNEMKDLAIDIGTEVRSHNKFLDGMEEDMDLTGGLLGGSMNRLAKVTGAKSSTQLMCYLVGFIVVVVMLIWHLIR
eukprot:gene12779-5568_t